MTPERWQRVKTVMDGALDAGAESREEYLAEVCGPDRELHREVAALLAMHARAGGFLETPAVIVMAAPEPQNGDEIGPYRIEEKIGQGGMGAVFRAVRADGHYRQLVALKLVKRGMDSDLVLRQFRNERQILAGLAHPNIARLLDGGAAADGRPYFVMEHIDGMPLGNYCEQHQLGLEERLDLFGTICGAVHYAHQRLVIHRDIKPGNILVTADGQPKLLDFGIAKITVPDRSATATAAAIMTPEFASPEQLAGQPITTASDVYSLGLLLYFLLTGARMEAGDAQRPSLAAPARMRRAVAGDLDSIAMKALREEPNLRYSSADELAADIRRYREGLPVLARKGTSAYQLTKFARKHKAGIAAAAAVLVALTAGFAATAWEARIAHAERIRAERRFDQVRKLTNSLLFQVHDSIKNLPGSTPVRAFLVREALEYLDSLNSGSAGDSGLQREIAAAYAKVGEVQGNPMFPNLGDTQGALRSYRKALAIRQALFQRAGDNALRMEIAETYGHISDILAVASDTSSAAENSAHALAMYAAVRPESRDRKFRSTLATRTYVHAGLLRQRGDLEGSLAAYRRAADTAQELIGADGNDAEARAVLAGALDGVGIDLLEKGDAAGALAERQRALAIRERLAAGEPNNAHYRRQLGFSHFNVALALVGLQDQKGALHEFRQALAIFESLHAADPDDVQGRRNLSLAHKQIGDVLAALPDPKGALSEYDRALRIDQELCAKDPANGQALLDLSFSQGKAGLALVNMGKRNEGMSLLRAGIQAQKSLLQKDPANDLLRGYLANSYTRLAKSCLPGDAAAVGYYRDAVNYRQTWFERTPDNAANRAALAECHTNLARAIAASDREEALRSYERAIALLEGVTAANPNNVAFRAQLTLARARAGKLQDVR
jgi:serine/threonine protein kinase